MAQGLMQSLMKCLYQTLRTSYATLNMPQAPLLLTWGFLSLSFQYLSHLEELYKWVYFPHVPATELKYIDEITCTDLSQFSQEV